MHEPAHIHCHKPQDNQEVEPALVRGQKGIQNRSHQEQIEVRPDKPIRRFGKEEQCFYSPTLSKNNSYTAKGR